MSHAHADVMDAPAQESDDEPLVADSPAPPPSAARWRVVLFRELHRRRAHVLASAVIVLDVLCNVAGLLLALFTCKMDREERPAAVHAAESALRYTSIALLSLMVLEFLARAAAVGPACFLRIPAHALDGVVLIGVLAVEAAVSDQAAEQAVGLLVVLRLARMGRLLISTSDYAAERSREARDARLRELEARVGELRAALRAAEDKLDGVARV